MATPSPQNHSLCSHSSTLRILQTDIQTLTNSSRDILDSIAQFAQLSLPANGAWEGGEEDDEDEKELQRLELLGIIQDGLRRQEDNLEIASQRLADFWSTPAFGERYAGSSGLGGARGGPDMKEQLSLRIARLNEDFKRARSRFRRVQLQASAAKRIKKRKENELFLASMAAEFDTPEDGSDKKGGSSVGTPDLAPSTNSLTTPDGTATPVPTEKDGERKAQPDQALPLRRKTKRSLNPTRDSIRASAAEQVTVALQQTLELLQAELARSHAARQAFEESSEGLRNLATQYSTVDNILSASRSLVSTLLRSQKSDTWYLETAFYMLLVTIGWLLFRRLLYGPMWWFVWLPLKILVKTVWIGVSIAGAMMKRKGETGEIVVPMPAAQIQPVEVPVLAPAVGFDVSEEWKEMHGHGGEYYQPSRVAGEDAEHGSVAASLSDRIAATILGVPSGASQVSSQFVPIATVSGPSPSAGSSGSGQRPVVRRGDGQVLRDSNEPRNPMKRMMEEPAPESGSGSAPVRRGDGQVLRDSDQPRNPMKRMMEEPAGDTGEGPAEGGMDDANEGNSDDGKDKGNKNSSPRGSRAKDGSEGGPLRDEL